MDCLSKEQLLLLQHNLTYEVYEKFMGLFFQDEILPNNEKERELYILKTMKEHDYWGEIKGWGDKRVYKNIAQINKLNCYSMFKGTTKKELVEFLDNFRIDYHIHNDLLLPVSDDEEEKKTSLSLLEALRTFVADVRHSEKNISAPSARRCELQARL